MIMFNNYSDIYFEVPALTHHLCYILGRPTSEFPHPLSRVKQSAGNRVRILFLLIKLWKSVHLI